MRKKGERKRKRREEEREESETDPAVAAGVAGVVVPERIKGFDSWLARRVARR